MNTKLTVLREIKLRNGQQLVLREPTIEDAESIIKYANTVGGESDNLLFGKDEFHLTLEQEVEFIKKINTDNNILMIIGTINDEIVSLSHIGSSNRKRIAHNSEMSISVKKEYWRNGIATVVMEELIRFAKQHNAIKNVSLAVKANNSNAIALYEKFGFEKVGIHKNYFNINGIFDDEILMDLYL